MEYKFKIQDLPREDRPRERMILWGAETLSDIELLAILIGSGTGKEGVLQLSQRLIAEYGGLHSLFQTGMARLQKTSGVGPAKACLLAACFELSKRLTSQQRILTSNIRTPDDVAAIYMSQMRYLKQEHLKSVYLDIKNRLLDQRTISIGTLDSSIIHPRDIFRHALDLPCAALILIHNHPSGQLTPSKEDLLITNQLVASGETVGIPVHDHLIIAGDKYFSLKEAGHM